jgi:hypothetical protein
MGSISGGGGTAHRQGRQAGRRVILCLYCGGGVGSGSLEGRGGEERRGLGEYIGRCKCRAVYPDRFRL